ncbi:MAG: hypothetical protein WA188_08345 [Terriglobales bacterium]
MKLSTNRDLYDYLVSLSEQLKSRGAEELGTLVADASRLTWDIPATPFLGESRLALREVARKAGALLNQEEHSDLADVLGQLDTAFDRR